MLFKKFKLLIIFLLLIWPVITQSTNYVATGIIYHGNVNLEYRNVTVFAPAVAQTEIGYVGVTSTITVTIQNNGNGRVFVDTLPLTQIDMQGSARLAVKVASSLVTNDKNCVINPNSYDYFFVIRTNSPVIGGPSAGAIMAIAVTALLQNWTIDSKTMMTGMINPDGSIGPVGGIIQKVDAAYLVGSKRFLIPKGQDIYTETVTETNSDNGWTQITTKQIVRNVSEYGMQNYGIEVKEVEDINDALYYFTGWNFSLIESIDSITTEDYVNSMKPLATKLLVNSKNAFLTASNYFENTTISNKYPYYYKNQITEFLNNAEETLSESENWFDQQIYYTSTSKSFQSLISSNFVTYACQYFSSENNEDYILNLIEKTLDLKKNKTLIAKNADINGAITLQCVGAAQKRASEADGFLNDAYSSYKNGDFLSTLYGISYATQRIKSIEWWINISNFFNDTGDIDNEDLDTLAGEYIDDAQQSLIYSRLILDEMSESSSYLNDAEDLLELANSDRTKGYPAAALFEALEVLSKANLALELVDGLTQYKLDRYQESASSSISKSRLMGIEPILAVSYYEYAESLLNESSTNTAVFYFKYSDLIPGVLTLTGRCGNESSRYYGVPEVDISIWPSFLNLFIFNNLGYLFIFGLLIFLIGFSFGIVVDNLTSKKDIKFKGKKNKSKNNQISHIEKSEKDYFTKHNMPRSIEDYYKRKNQ
jgi:uncharacterized protein